MQEKKLFVRACMQHTVIIMESSLAMLLLQLSFATSCINVGQDRSGFHSLVKVDFDGEKFLLEKSSKKVH